MMFFKCLLNISSSGLIPKIFGFHSQVMDHSRMISSTIFQAPSQVNYHHPSSQWVEIGLNLHKSSKQTEGNHFLCLDYGHTNFYPKQLCLASFNKQKRGKLPSFRCFLNPWIKEAGVPSVSSPGGGSKGWQRQTEKAAPVSQTTHTPRKGQRVVNPWFFFVIERLDSIRRKRDVNDSLFADWERANPGKAKVGVLGSCRKRQQSGDAAKP